MKLGFDFDGVFTDPGHMKAQYLQQTYGITMEPHMIKREIIVGQGILTEEQYDKVKYDIFFSEEWNAKMKAVDGAIEYMNRLKDEGHDIRVVTNRSEKARDIAENWLQQRGIHVPVYGIGKRGNKAPACKGLDMFVDDDLDKLENLVGIVPNLYLFTWKHNEHHTLSGIERVHNWEELYGKIKELQTVNT